MFVENVMHRSLAFWSNLGPFLSQNKLRTKFKYYFERNLTLQSK